MDRQRARAAPRSPGCARRAAPTARRSTRCSTPCILGHFGIVDAGGNPVVIPTAIVRDGDRVLAHGSTGSPWMRRLAAGAPTCLAVTALDGIVVARSAFESSLHYRSAVLFGTCTVVAGQGRARST